MCDDSVMNHDEHRISSNVGSSCARQFNITTQNDNAFFGLPGKDYGASVASEASYCQVWIFTLRFYLAIYEACRRPLATLMDANSDVNMARFARVSIYINAVWRVISWLYLQKLFFKVYKTVTQTIKFSWDPKKHAAFIWNPG